MKRRMVEALIIGVMAAVTASVARAVGDQPQTEAQDVAVLAEQSGCLKCHAIETKVIGPAFRDVATKYKSDPGAREKLLEKVKKGGKGNWTEVTGGVLMPPHSALIPDRMVAQLVDWVLSR
jgi:cytochrome c551/c552